MSDKTGKQITQVQDQTGLTVLPCIMVLFVFSEKSRRRTKTIMNSNEPTWNQTFMYDSVTIADLRNSLLEITVWDYDRMGPSEFMGEVFQSLLSKF